jgi:hypothetical protein
VTAVPIDAAVDIPRKDLRVRQQLMREHDGLRRLQMREPGRQCVDVLDRLADERVLQIRTRVASTRTSCRR